MTGRSRSSNQDPIASGPASGADPAVPDRIDAEALGPCERRIFDRWADHRGQVGDLDIDTLLRQNLILRRLIAELVASAGRPLPDRSKTGYLAEVPTELLEQVSEYADFSQIPDLEAVGKDWF